MNKIIIEPSNQFNAGWLGYVLGLDAPDQEQNPEAYDGWKMGADTRDLKPIRNVFIARTPRDDEQPSPFLVTLVIDTTGAVVVTEETTPTDPVEQSAVPVRTTKMTKESGRE